MSDLHWHTCKHCKKDKYSTDGMFRDHEEDCGYKMAQHRFDKPCPKCQGLLTKVLPGSWICTNEACDYQIGIVGGKEPE